ncbi:hypothetical protein ACOME3_009757 [Neoechinorhynchus agilis]
MHRDDGLAFVSPVRIQLIGDSGVGKTSLMLSLINDEYFDAAQFFSSDTAVLPRAATFCEDILIMKSSNGLSDCIISDLGNGCDIQLSDVYCLLVEGGFHEDNGRCHLCHQLNRLQSHWIPKVKRLYENIDGQSKRINTIQDAITPCLMIVISKEDIADPNCISDCDCCTRSLKRVIQSFNEIECVVSCSSRLMADIAHVFYRAQKSFFYPTRHLIASYHPLTFNDQFISILQHVFFLMSNFHDSFNKDRLELSSFIESQPHLPDSIQLDQFYKIIKDSIVNLRPERAWSIIEVFYERNLTFHNHLVANKGYTEKQLIDFILSVDFNDNYERIIRQYRIAAYFNQFLGPKRNLYVVASHLLSLKRLSEQDFEEFLGYIGFGLFLSPKVKVEKTPCKFAVAQCYVAKLISSDEKQIEQFICQMPNGIKFSNHQTIGCVQMNDQYWPLVISTNVSSTDFDVVCLLDAPKDSL